MKPLKMTECVIVANGGFERLFANAPRLIAGNPDEQDLRKELAKYKLSTLFEGVDIR